MLFSARILCVLSRMLEPQLDRPAALCCPCCCHHQARSQEARSNWETALESKDRAIEQLEEALASRQRALVRLQSHVLGLTLSFTRRGNHSSTAMHTSTAEPAQPSAPLLNCKQSSASAGHLQAYCLRGHARLTPASPRRTLHPATPPSVKRRWRRGWQQHRHASGSWNPT